MRLSFADCLKGLCICFMILGHCKVSEITLSFIYLFHIPAFFFLSGYFFKEKSVKELIKNAWRNLYVPYIFCALPVVLKFSIDAFRLTTSQHVWRYLKSVFVVGPVFNLDVGPIWFLASLAVCKIFYGVVYKVKYGEWFAFFLSILVMFLGEKLLMPFGISQGIAALSFYIAGKMYHKYELQIFKKISLAFVTLTGMIVLSLFVPALDMHTLHFPITVVNYIMSLLTVVSLVVLLKHLNLNVLPFKMLSKIGKCSIVVLAVHYAEFMTFDWNKYFATEEYIVFVRLLLDVLLALILCRISFVKRLFCIKS